VSYVRVGLLKVTVSLGHSCIPTITFGFGQRTRWILSIFVHRGRVTLCLGGPWEALSIQGLQLGLAVNVGVGQLGRVESVRMMLHLFVYSKFFLLIIN